MARYLPGLLAAVLFGCSAPLITLLASQGGALAVAALLYLGASLALLIVRAFAGGSGAETPIQWGVDLPALAGLTLLGGVLGPWLLVLGLERLPAAAGALMLNLEAVFTLLIAVLVGKEHLGRRGVLAASLTLAGAVVLSRGSLGGASTSGALLIAAATLAWGIDNNLSQRLSLRDPLQLAGFKATCASLPMLLLAWGLGQPFPPWHFSLQLLLVGALGYGISIWLDFLALRRLGAAREAVVFSTAPFVGAIFAVVVLRSPLSTSLLGAAVLMAFGVVLLIGEEHSHRHRHRSQHHDHRHQHSPDDVDPHHDHSHSADQLAGQDPAQTFWHAHPHEHAPIEHSHSHVSDAHHRHPHAED